MLKLLVVVDAAGHRRQPVFRTLLPLPRPVAPVPARWALTLRIGLSVTVFVISAARTAILADTGLLTKTKSNSHTTSTKCQYQATPSKAKWRSELKCPFGSVQITVSMMAPRVTWKP